MKRRLLKKAQPYFFTCALLFGALQLTAQQLQKQYNGPLKGHALYKSTKIYDSKTGATGAKPKPVGDRALDRIAYEREMLQDPNTQQIPQDIFTKEASFCEKIPVGDLIPSSFGKNESEAARNNRRPWKKRGPTNVGGRTRALALDIKNENIILAGGVSGGLYRSTDLGGSWKKVTNPRQSPSITAIVQDPRRGFRNIWYYASGERFGNSASGGSAFFQGSGIYKSNDGGRSFKMLKGSNDDDVTSLSPFDIINSIAVNPNNGDVFAATFNGVFKSERGGKDFEEVLPSGFDSNTEVIITPSGKIYATVDFFGEENAGFFVSDDGENFTDITPEGILPTFGRTVVAYDPSDENRLYFFSHNANPRRPPSEPLAFLWRYQADAETDEERWVDLTLNLPLFLGSRAGDLNLQGAYNMVIKVHPTNPDIVFVGGTNLYRSVTGFTTPTGFEGWIGGYNVFTNNFALYPNHHPDQHNLVFLPSNPDRAITGNDGGVQLTNDIADNTTPVEWISLNNNYLTTQPYTVAFDPETRSRDLLAGFQDNGTWFTDSKKLLDPWAEDFGGDGAYCAIADSGRTRYVSAQLGQTFRLNFDEAGTVQSFSAVSPAGGNRFGFIAPFLLDPNNDNIMYYPAGNVIWRNNNLDNLPLGGNAVTKDWALQNRTATPDNSRITALDISKFPIANTLYYGTQSGLIYKLENANLEDQEPIDISTGKGLPGGFVSCITVDPKNPDRVFVVFSNYNIPSVFFTKNGGETWRNISGNLEENKDGTGNGPSVRWFSILGRDNGYFVGTSTGLYFTRNLSGFKTTWKRINAVGNNVIPQVRTRKDGFVAAAAHGNGLFSASYNVTQLPQPTLEVAQLLDDVMLPVNFSDEIVIDLNEVFTSSKGKRKISFELINSNPELADAEITGSKLRISIAPELADTADISIVARSGKEQVSEGFRISAVIYGQNDAIVGSTPSQFIPDFNALLQAADDFTVPDGTRWSISRIIVPGASNGLPSFDNILVSILQDVDGLPGEEVFSSGIISPISNIFNSVLDIVLPEKVELEPGTYWLSVIPFQNFNPSQTQWFWASQAQVAGNEASFRDPVGLFGTGIPNWAPKTAFFGGIPQDQVFQIFGSARPVNADLFSKAAPVVNSKIEDTLEEELASLQNNVLVSVWPNPSSQNFEFSIVEAKDPKVTTRIYNILGQLVHEIRDHSANQSFNWDASKSPKGMYFVKINGQHTNSNFKIIKQ